MKHLIFLLLFLMGSISSFGQKQEENIFRKISVNNPVTKKSQTVNPVTDVSTIAIINTSNTPEGLAREILVRLKGDNNAQYHIIDMNAKTDQDIFNANKYFILANMGYIVPEIKDKCWSIIKIRGVNYIALFIDITKE